MRIKIEDNNGNDLCEFNIRYLTNPNRIYDYEDCSFADIGTDSKGNYLRIQLEN